VKFLPLSRAEKSARVSPEARAVVRRNRSGRTGEVELERRKPKSEPSRNDGPNGLLDLQQIKLQPRQDERNEFGFFFSAAVQFVAVFFAAAPHHSGEGTDAAFDTADTGMAALRPGSARGARAESGGSPDSPSSDRKSRERSMSDKVFGGPPKTAREPRALPEHLRTLITLLRGDVDWIGM
jgi:hypothetical protein